MYHNQLAERQSTCGKGYKSYIKAYMIIFNGNSSTTIISCDNPTNTSDEIDIIIITYNKLSSSVQNILKHIVLVIIRGMNTQISKAGNNNFSLHNLPNRNEEHRADFSLKNRVAYLNTKFQKKGISLNANIIAQLEFEFVF